MIDNFLKLKSYAYYKAGTMYNTDSLLESLDIELTPLEERVYVWGRDNWRTLVDLLEKDITEETIRDYMIDNNCEDLPVDWVVNLLSD
jgi:hypothetical protein